jgi:hypothetical protein
MAIARKIRLQFVPPYFGAFHKSMFIQSMHNKPWGPEDGELLQSIREKAGMDALVFARANTISLAQLQELEGGEGRGGDQSDAGPGHGASGTVCRPVLCGDAVGI